MDLKRAKDLLECLADGINPITDEVLAAEDSCNQIEIVRALNLVLRQLDNQAKILDRGLSDNTGRPWTKEDEIALCCMFDAGCSKLEICKHFRRSVGAIAARLVKLGKIGERDEFGKE